MNDRQILTVEDDSAIRRGIVDALEYAGYSVLQAGTGDLGMQMAVQCTYDLLLLDLVLPGRSGFEILQSVRATRPTQPVIILTARGEENDRVEGLRMGADDYVVKPFSVKELLARVEAVLRRSQLGQEMARTLNVGGIDIDTANLSGTKDGNEVTFTKREIEVLSYLAQNCDRAVSREELLSKVWGYARNLDIETRTVDIHIAKLRRKIEDNNKAPELLTTVRGAGYRLVIED